MTSEAPGVVAEGVSRFELAEHNCFACGTLNEHGLRLVLHVEPGRSWVETSLDPRFEGWDGVAHGGIVTTILDEVMAWALVGSDNWGVTARMSVDFRLPVRIGRPIRAEGWTTSERRRIAHTEGVVRDAEGGDVLATATGVYVAATGDRKRELQERYGFRVVEPTSQPSEGTVDTPAQPTDTPGAPTMGGRGS